MKKQPPRNIYCLEGNWRTNPRCRQSVRPILDILRDAAGIKYIYRKCNTREEFFEYLRQYTFVRYRNYTILQDCFPFITCKDVCETLHKAGFSLTVARIITRLTTYQGHLPQGAPTSSIIQNLVFDYKVGRDIAKLAKEQGLTFTSFVDDITLSAPWNFQHLGNNIINAILSANLKISYRKTSFKSAQPIITGVKRGNNYLTIPDSQRSKFQDAALSADQKKGLEAYKKRIEKISPK